MVYAMDYILQDEQPKFRGSDLTLFGRPRSCGYKFYENLTKVIALIHLH